MMLVTTPHGLKTNGFSRNVCFLKAPSEPTSFDINGSVMISIQYDPARRTGMCTLTQVFMWAFHPTCAAYLAGIPGINKCN